MGRDPGTTLWMHPGRTWTRGSRVWSTELGIVLDCLDVKMTMNGWWLGEIVCMYVCQTDRQGYPLLYKASQHLYCAVRQHCTLSQLHDAKISSRPRITLRINLQGSCVVIIAKCIPPFYSERGNARSSGAEPWISGSWKL